MASVLPVGFLHWAMADNVRVIGGLPTGFVDSPISDAAVAAIHAIYRNNDAGFSETPDAAATPAAPSSTPRTT